MDKIYVKSICKLNHLGFGR